MNWLTITHQGHAHSFTSLTAALVWAEEQARRQGRAVEVRGAATGTIVAVVDPDGRTREPAAQASRMGGKDE